MRKRLFSLVILAMLLIFPYACVLAEDLPDAAGLENSDAALEEGDTQVGMRVWTYSGDETLQKVFEEYVQWLENRGDLKLAGRLTPEDSEIMEMRWYDYTGDAEIADGRITIGSLNFACSCDIFVRCEKQEDVYRLMLCASNGLGLADGEETDAGEDQPASEANAAEPEEKPAEGMNCTRCGGKGQIKQRCSGCGGRGTAQCDSCKGSGGQECTSCAGKGRERCPGCGGMGEKRCSACRGKGQDEEGRPCKSCSGNGARRCPGCKGVGMRACPACRGKGGCACGACGGEGSADCARCSGKGYRTMRCVVCSGSGRREELDAGS